MGVLEYQLLRWDLREAHNFFCRLGGHIVSRLEREQGNNFSFVCDFFTFLKPARFVDHGKGLGFIVVATVHREQGSREGWKARACKVITWVSKEMLRDNNGSRSENILSMVDTEQAHCCDRRVDGLYCLLWTFWTEGEASKAHFASSLGAM